MGTFIGHAVPGAFFIVFAIWWMVQHAYKQIALDNGRLRPRNRLLRILSRYPCEGIVITFFAVCGVFGEQMYPVPKWSIIDGNGQFQHPNEWQHCTMYTYFGLYGFNSILSQTCLPSSKAYQHLIGALAFFIEGLLFYFHTHGREPLDVHIHELLVIAVWLCAFTTLAESFKPDDVRLSVMRMTFTLFQGTWFWQVAIILYNPMSGEPWEQDNHKNMMFITVSFAWHLIIDMAIMFGVYGIVNMIVRATGNAATKYSSMHDDRRHSLEDGMEVKMGLLSKETGNHIDADDDDDDSEIG